MSAILHAALISAAGVTLVELILALSGWIADPTLSVLAWSSLPVVVLAAARGVRGSAREGRDYVGQIVAGVELGILAGLFAALTTGLIHQVIIPSTLADARALAEARVLAAGGDAEALANAAGLASPFGRAMLRFLEVMLTSLVTGLAVARRPPSSS